MAMKSDELLAFLCPTKSDPMVPRLRQWLEGSVRFKDFAERYRDKIRKKLRVAQGEEGRRDILLELEVAFWLLGERRFDVVYEPYAHEKERGPDFAVTFRTNKVFHVEVTRIRAGHSASSGDGPRSPREYEAQRLVEVVCGKLGQMRPSLPNALLVAVTPEVATLLDVAGTMQGLRQRAEQKDAALLSRTGFEAWSDFFKGYQRLSALLLWTGQGAPLLWANNQARFPLDEGMQRGLRR